MFVTGNTVVDALLQVQARIEADAALRAALDAALPPARPGKRRILVHVPFAGSYSSALVREPLKSLPPAASTWPLDSNVAVE